MSAKPYRCPGCGQFETVVTIDESVRVGVVVTETIPLRYCQKCRTAFMATLRPAGEPTPATSTPAGTIS
jgi:hypothetical protein